MHFPVFSQLARKLGFRDEFAPDCLLQQRVSSKLESDTPGMEGQTRTQQCRRRPRKRGHRGSSEKAIAKPAASAANDSSAMTGTGGRGAGLAGGWKLPRSVGAVASTSVPKAGKEAEVRYFR